MVTSATGPDGALLVSEVEDGSPTGFARPLGGSLEFGELAMDAIQREFREELACGLLDLSLRTGRRATRDLAPTRARRRLVARRAPPYTVRDTCVGLPRARAGIY